MDENIRELMNDEIEDELKDLASMRLGSEEHTEAVDTLVKLYKLRLEEMKLEREFEDKRERRTMEAEHHSADVTMKQQQLLQEDAFHECDVQQKEKQLSVQKKDIYFKLGIEAAGIILPLMFYACWINKGLKFEETGTFTSGTFKGLINRFRPTKK
jgi:hypothetical protein